MDRNDNFDRTYPIPGLALLLIIAIVPALASFVSGFGSIVRVFSDPSMLMAMAYSAILAMACSLASLLLGMPGAYMMSTFRFPTKGLFKLIFSLALLAPSTIVAIYPDAIMALLPKNLPRIPYPWLETGVLLTVFNVPVVIILVSFWWSRIDSGIEKTAASLGTKPSRIFKTLTMPRLRPALVGSGALVFIRCFSSLAVVLSVADGTDYMNTASLMHLFKSAGDFSTAGAFSMFTALVSVLACLFVISMSNRFQDSSQGKVPRRPGSAGSRILIALYMLLSFILLVLPALAVLFCSVHTETGFSFDSYYIFGDLATAGTGALVYSAIVAFVSAIVSTFIALRLSRAGSPIPLIAMGLGPAVIGLGYSYIAKMIPAVPALVFSILANVAIEAPVAYLVILPAMKQVPDGLSKSSRSLGYSSSSSFRKIDRRIVSGSTATAFLVSIIISLGEFGTALFLNGKTLTSLLFSTAKTDLQGACTIATVMGLLYTVLFLVAASLMKSEEGDQNV